MTVSELIAAAQRAGACQNRLAAAREWARKNPNADWRAAAQARPEDAGWLARNALELSAGQRIELAREATPYWRGVVACHAPDLSAAQRMSLAHESTPWWRGEVAGYVPGLSAAQRAELLKTSQ